MLLICSTAYVSLFSYFWRKADFTNKFLLRGLS